jgi:hypothetical protein
MGWAYGASYTKVRNHAVWSSATNECVYYPWRGQLPYFWIYGDRGDGIFHGVGDNFSNTSTGDWGSLVVAAGVLKNPHAAWYVRNLSERRSYRDRFWDVLYGDKSVKPLAPGGDLGGASCGLGEPATARVQPGRRRAAPPAISIDPHGRG